MPTPLSTRLSLSLSLSWFAAVILNEWIKISIFCGGRPPPSPPGGAFDSFNVKFLESLIKCLSKIRISKDNLVIILFFWRDSWVIFLHLLFLFGFYCFFAWQFRIRFGCFVLYFFFFLVNSLIIFAMLVIHSYVRSILYIQIRQFPKASKYFKKKKKP